MRVVALCSGGKDSSYALWLAMQSGHNITGVVAMIPRREDSWMFHFPNIRLIDLFAECSGLPLIKSETSGEREQELDDLKRVLQSVDAEGVVSGTVASKYQKSRIDKICSELGLKSLTPLWGMDAVGLIRNMLRDGFKIIITAVAAQGLDASWLGRELDAKALMELNQLNKKYGINQIGEGGEYESLVVDAPFFKRKIELLEAEPVWRGTNGYYLIKGAKVVGK